ncbi:MAG: hypothetical protein R3C01_02475 [Planctomycetaceae bacterium]
MARRKTKKEQRIDPRKLQGFKDFEMISEMLERLHDVGTARDRAGNRQLFFDQYATLMILYFFNPTVTSLGGVQQFTTLESAADVWSKAHVHGIAQRGGPGL